jgi:hypothetical protein
MLQTRISDLEILHWRRGHKEPAVHKITAIRGEGWGGHMGLAKIRGDFTQAKPLTAPANCVDGTLLAPPRSLFAAATVWSSTLKTYS